MFAYAQLAITTSSLIVMNDPARRLRTKSPRAVEYWIGPVYVSVRMSVKNNNLNLRSDGIEVAISSIMDPQNLAKSWQTPETTDHELVEQCKHGDEEAMAKLVRRHYGSSLRIARSILRNQSDSEDAVQTAYGRAFQHLHTFRKEARFSTWITSIVVNQTRMHLPATSCDSA